MSLSTTAHVNFRGEARQALQFYHSVFGGEIALVTYADAHAVESADTADQIMWGQVTADTGFRIMAYDVPAQLDWDAGTIPFYVSVRGDSAEEIRDLWRGLNQRATIIADLGPAGWSPFYGMLKDRFGVTWVLDVAQAYGS